MSQNSDCTTHIFQGNCFEILEQFPSKFFDYCLTSPFFKEKDTKEDYWPWFTRFFNLIKKKVSKVAFIFQSSINKKEMYYRFGEDIHRELIWGKEPSCYSYRHESIYVFLFDRTFKINKYIFKDFWSMPPILRNSKTYQNPPKLYREIIMLLPPGKIIDPFAGTGTLGLACRNLKHEYYLIDLKSIELPCSLEKFIERRETQVRL